VTCVCRACPAAAPSLTYLAVCPHRSGTLPVSPGPTSPAPDTPRRTRTSVPTLNFCLGHHGHPSYRRHTLAAGPGCQGGGWVGLGVPQPWVVWFRGLGGGGRSGVGGCAV